MKTIQLREVDPGNWRLGLHVSKEQEKYVSNSEKLLARAYAYRNYGSKAFVIYNKDEPVGMALYYECEALDCYDFSQLFIDERYQGNGFGFEAAVQILEMMKNDGKYKKAILCYIEGNEVARKLYEKVGFRLTGERDEDEIIMELHL